MSKRFFIKFKNASIIWQIFNFQIMKYNVNKSITINANIDEVKKYINDFKQWKTWSPWNICEPECRNDYAGQPGAIGHKMMWDGQIIGSGELTVEKMEGDMIDYHLQFFKPFKSSAKTSFIIEKKGENETKVTWTMDSSMPWFLFFMVKSMKNWLGMDYERGLTMLKSMAETGKVEATTTNEGVVPFEGFSYVGIQKTCEYKDMPKEMSGVFEKLAKDLEAKGKSPQNWVCLYPKVNMKTMMFTYICAVSDEQLKDVDMGGEYVKGEIKSGNVLKISHKGSYNFLGNAWSMGMMYLRAKKMKQAGTPFEHYVNDPRTTEEKDLQTNVCFPVR